MITTIVNVYRDYRMFSKTYNKPVRTVAERIGTDKIIGLNAECPKITSARKIAIERMGDKWILAKSVERKNGPST